MAAWWYRNTSDSDDTHDAPASVIAQRAASPRRKSTTGPGRTPPLSCDDAHSTSSKGGRADPAAIAAAAASSAAGAAPSAVAVTLGCITRAAAAHRLVLIQRRLELQASGTGVVVVRLPNVGAGGRGQSRYEERESERQEGPDSEQQPAWAVADVRPAFHIGRTPKFALQGAVPSETFSFEAQRRSRASGIGQP